MQKSATTTTGFQHWAIAFVLCNFNVDVGPEIESVFPKDVPFSMTDLSAICFNSFPEQHNADLDEDVMFTFSINNASPNIRTSGTQAFLGELDTLHGTCIFRQEVDERMKRSYTQRTLVIVSFYSLHTFYHCVLRQLMASGHIGDSKLLEAAHGQIMTWPHPKIGRQDLPFLGTIITLDIAPHKAFPLQGLLDTAPDTVHHNAQIVHAYEPLGSWNRIMRFMPCISELYVLFEKLVLCESIVLVTNTPQLAAEAVTSLIDMIRPIPYNGVLRPYMTMQSDFRSIGLDGGAPTTFIAGITNPFLLKRIMTAAEHNHRMRPHILYLQSFDGPVPAKRHHSLHRRLSRNALLDLPGGGIEAHEPTQRFIKPEHGLILTIETLLKNVPESNSIDSVVRRHFAEQAAQFLAPLNRHLAATNMISPGGSQRYSNFSVADFLRSLSKYGTTIKFRGPGPMQKHHARDRLYASFCQSANFHSWLEMKINLKVELLTIGMRPAGGHNIKD